MGRRLHCHWALWSVAWTLSPPPFPDPLETPSGVVDGGVGRGGDAIKSPITAAFLGGSTPNSLSRSLPCCLVLFPLLSPCPSSCLGLALRG